ncbi:MAG: DNA helicase UvrD [Nanoarchaeota archaeon]|nr:DNA helicase UvrD [Nanoarchaeota archaeon]
MIFADLHIHSKYSRATSKDMDIKSLSKFGVMKGLDIIGTGDITHPEWIKEVKSETEYLGNGLYKSKYNQMRFMLSSEIATIYSQDNEVKRVHHVLVFPDFEIVEQFNEVLRKNLFDKNKKCNLESDGRPIIGMTSVELAEALFEVSDKALLIPAHIWTPWFSLFGSMSGFNKIEDCYEKYAKKIYALETGLSSDPLMNWRIDNIRDYALVSNSDCHGPFVDRIGRESNAFNGSIEEFSFNKMREALKNKNLAFTVEVDPSYGKYHFDGHRKCNVCYTPKNSIEHNNKCPVCGKTLTIGVLHRVEELADHEEGYKPAKAVPFEYHIPLIEIISKLLGKGIKTKKVIEVYDALIKKFGNEYNIMFNAPIADSEAAFQGLGFVIKSLRDKSLKVEPGYDGVYGKPLINEINSLKPQMNLSDF